ncbi:hypothetical protein EOI86_20585 [Hwanghaeella grinnelliae]|uniref:Uncharacterized protein n=1 Tax=Hwanghaeella grinnelliae TaxID=2500179 RepID=A0A437QL25_9PROT|nr:hypothetical protein [Hwanghaeella grinnelliae]RVU35214.1 hypothetical protein EOI86_20585 [Hwanghaeella grinnelliae]
MPAQSVCGIGCNNYLRHRYDDRADFSDDGKAILTLVSKEADHVAGTELIVGIELAAAMPGQVSLRPVEYRPNSLKDLPYGGTFSASTTQHKLTDEKWKKNTIN